MGLLTAAVAKDLATQIVNRYKVSHNLPVIGVGIVNQSTPARIKNKQNQANYRANNTRFSEWKTADNAIIVDFYQKKLQALRVAKKAYHFALSNYAKLVHRLELIPPTTTTQGYLSAALTIKNDKLAIFEAAKTLAYTGDGTQ